MTNNILHRSVTINQMCQGFEQQLKPKGHGLPVYTNVRRFRGANVFVEQHTVTFPHGNKFMSSRKIEAALIFELRPSDGKCVRMDEFLHAKEASMLLLSEHYYRPPREAKL